jgi:hypothetical protein
MNEQSYWRKCGSCKREIPFKGIYQQCGVSSCRKTVFCSVTCWDVHAPVMNHKNGYCEENRAPSKEEFMSQEESGSKRRIVVNTNATSHSMKSQLPSEVLIVVSKLKAYIKARGDMNTAGNVMDVLSEIVRQHCNDAIDRARADGRKTVMDRDFS